MQIFDLFPLWVCYGLARVLVTATISLFQEKVKADGYALAFWTKVFVAVLSLPFVAYYGLPSSPAFYAVIFLTASIWCVGDVIYYKAVPIVGAAVVSRLSPLAIIATFFLWFFFDHALFFQYLEHPAKSGAIVLAILAATGFAFRLRKCAVSSRAIRMTWFLIVATCLDSIILKLLLDSAPSAQGVFAFVFTQALMMIGLWAGYSALKKPVPRAEFFSKKTLYAGACVGGLAAVGVCLRSFGLINVDNPAYLSVILLLDSALIAGFNKLRGHQDKSDMVSGFGIVICALALVVIKSLPN